jgi:hypothetical protein
MRGKKWVLIIMVIWASCSGKTQNAAVTETPPSENAVEAETGIGTYKPLAMFVGSKEGLRVRDTPDVSGNVLGVLPFQSEILTVDRSDTEAVIDNIRDYWYAFQTENGYGWVFGGYLKNSIAEIEQEGIAGKYYVNNIEVKVRENVTHRDEFMRLDNDMEGRDDINFEISRIEGYSFNLNNNLPFYRHERPEYNNRTFSFPVAEGKPFCTIDGDKGGGGTYLKFYYFEDYILLDLHYFMGYLREEADEDGKITQEFKCLITFMKGE